jgi:hypothetical protein
MYPYLVTVKDDLTTFCKICAISIFNLDIRQTHYLPKLVFQFGTYKVSNILQQSHFIGCIQHFFLLNIK